jgi:hypothetical protein
MSASEPLSKFGELEEVFQPSPGQTFAGVFVSVGLSAAGFAAAAFGCGLNATNRVGGAVLGVALLGLAYWLYRQRRWRVTLFSSGLVQVRHGGVDELLWPEVREFVDTRLKGFGDRTVRVTIVTASGPVVVNPVNFRSRSRLFAALVAAAERHGIPVRVEWEETD